MMEVHLVAPSSNGYATSNGASTRSIGATSISSYANTKKRKKTTPDHVFSSSSSASLSAKSAPDIAENSGHLQDPPVKRKRGRPPKNSKQQQIQQKSSSIQPQCTGNDSIDEGRETGSSRSKRYHLQSNKVKRGINADNGDSSSLHELMSRFEDQYNEMGQRYAEMGTLLAQMKTAIYDRRTQSEQEIRRELLEEVQRSILNNMPKR